jgi:hypothetical protein
MSNIINFPRPPIKETVKSAAPKSKDRGLVVGLLKCVWMMTVLAWPLLRWALSIDVLFQFVRMVYHWNTPGAFAGWTFVLHFVLLTAFTYYVSIYKPKGL